LIPSLLRKPLEQSIAQLADHTLISKWKLAMRLIEGKSLRKKAGWPSIGDPVDEIRLQNIGVQLPI